MLTNSRQKWMTFNCYGTNPENRLPSKVNHSHRVFTAVRTYQFMLLILTYCLLYFLIIKMSRKTYWSRILRPHHVFFSIELCPYYVVSCISYLVLNIPNWPSQSQEKGSSNLDSHVPIQCEVQVGNPKRFFLASL